VNGSTIARIPQRNKTMAETVNHRLTRLGTIPKSSVPGELSIASGQLCPDHSEWNSIFFFQSILAAAPSLSFIQQTEEPADKKCAAIRKFRRVRISPAPQFEFVKPRGACCPGRQKLPGAVHVISKSMFEPILA